jgi:hypothetical protein
MHQTLQRVELLNLNNIIQPANKNIALDFLANAMPIPSQGYWYRSMIRGKRVSFWEDRLNQFMGIAAPKECAVERPVRELKEMDEERRTVVVLNVLCR